MSCDYMHNYVEFQYNLSCGWVTNVIPAELPFRSSDLPMRYVKLIGFLQVG
jgi:hypothetical protein